MKARSSIARLLFVMALAVPGALVAQQPPAPPQTQLRPATNVQLRPEVLDAIQLPRVTAPAALTPAQTVARLATLGINLERGPAPGRVQRLTAGQLVVGSSQLWLFRAMGIWMESGQPVAWIEPVTNAQRQLHGRVTIRFDAPSPGRYLVDLSVAAPNSSRPLREVVWASSQDMRRGSAMDLLNPEPLRAPVTDGHALLVVTATAAGPVEVSVGASMDWVFLAAEISQL